MSVQKIDIESNFNDLITNIKTEQELSHAGSKIVNNNYKIWIKKLNIDSNGELEWVNSKIQDIINICSDSPKPSTQRIRYEALANLLLLINKNAYKQIAKELFKKSITIQKEISEIKDNQEYNEKEEESRITFNDMVMYRDKYKNRNDIKGRMCYIILCVNTYIPPLRLDYVENEKEPIMFGVSDMNYIKDGLNFDGDDYMTLHIEKDKVSQKVGSIDLEFKNYSSKSKQLFIDGNSLKNVIRDSYVKAPRKYVIHDTFDINKPMSANQYYRVLAKIFNKPVTQNSIRKAYINHWYDPSLKLSLKDKKIIASYMRNSVSIAESIYKKLN